jgi:hypothetical protein
MKKRIALILAMWLSLGAWLVENYAPKSIKSSLARLNASQAGNIVNKVIFLVLGFVIVGALIPALWPVVENSAANVTAMNSTTTGGTLIKTLWPVGLVVAAVGIGVFIIYFAIKQLGLGGIGGGGGRWHRRR